LQERILRNVLGILKDDDQVDWLSWLHNSVDYCFVAMKKK